MEPTLPRVFTSDNVECFEHEGGLAAESGTGSLADRWLFEEFLRTRDRCRGALVALNDRLMIMNASAGEVLDPTERPRLWKVAKATAAQGSAELRELCLSNGECVMASHRPVMRDGAVIGVLLQFSSVDSRPRTSSSRRTDDANAPGWQDLTTTEQRVARVVASGLTNREAGRRTYMSPHTVDAHLRHIFHKLDINSRVELARIVGEQHQQSDSSEHDAVAAATLWPPPQNQPSRSA
jgi:DNA-binding CsgD family transcriptional regulator